MALTELQRHICKLLANDRRTRGDSYVAGGVALNELLRGRRVSHDIDLFHDTAEALARSWDADRALLSSNGFVVEAVRERPTFVQARVSHSGHSVLLEWAQDSAFRFFPLIEHPALGLTLHPFDLATNKVLALAGRRETRDFVDTVRCHEALQPLGYLVWAACGKDPGFGPKSLLAEARRTSRYTQVELDALDFQGTAPPAAALAETWRTAVAEAEVISDVLPSAEAGKCVLGREGALSTLRPSEIADALAAGAVRFHRGSIQGAFPIVVG